ncbi:type 4 prepilin-like proteins leader peptide-processing enzyme [bacterium BMS3Abin15]|nr:type 4 prepilin-like proteins leader peptide-processing enzyme [bacterium BMS3Abin15]HDZ85336.1 prepilin peptidase [Candidatus Moranbacteria bacterium]
MTAIFFITGLIIGSFLNVVVYRLNLVESVSGRSHCPYCKKKIRWYDNVPILSFIILGTKCRDCGEKISWQYPLLEMTTGVAFAFTGNYFFMLSNPISWIETLFYLVIFSLLLVIFTYDLKFMEIPMIILWIAVGWTIIYFLFADWVSFNPQLGIMSLNIFSGAIGGGVAFLFFFILVSVSREKWMGMGDAYLALLIGLVLGWPKILFALMIAFTVGAIVGIILISVKKKTMKSQIPFAPFMVIGAVVTIFILQSLPYIKYLLWYY